MSASEQIQHLEKRKEEEKLSLVERMEIEDQILHLKYQTGEKQKPQLTRYFCDGCGS